MNSNIKTKLVALTNAFISDLTKFLFCLRHFYNSFLNRTLISLQQLRPSILLRWNLMFGLMKFVSIHGKEKTFFIFKTRFSAKSGTCFIRKSSQKLGWGTPIEYWAICRLQGLSESDQQIPTICRIIVYQIQSKLANSLLRCFYRSKPCDSTIHVSRKASGFIFPPSSIFKLTEQNYKDLRIYNKTENRRQLSIKVLIG